jgi:hypothetical protein
MPDVVVASECAVSGPSRNRGILNLYFLEELEWSLFPQCFEGAITPVTWLRPEFSRRKVNVSKWDYRQCHEGNLVSF